jgi:hypothetical protein
MCQEIHENYAYYNEQDYIMRNTYDIYNLDYQIYNTNITNITNNIRYYKNTSRTRRMKLYKTLRGAYAVDAHIRRIRQSYIDNIINCTVTK